MRRLYTLLLLAFLTGCGLRAQPSWDINPNDYQYSMTITGVIWFDQVESINPEDQVAAFSGGEIRGTANCQYVSSLDRYFVFLTIYSNDVQGDSLYYQIYNAENDIVYTVDLQNIFLTDQNIGSANIPVIFSYPALNNQTDILAFSLPGETSPAIINPETHSIGIEVADTVFLGELIADYELSMGANAVINNTVQQSGATPNNFSSPLTYRVIAQNGYDSQDWVVTVTGGIVSSIKDLKEEGNLEIYPNPARDVLYVDLNHIPRASAFQYSIIDAAGKYLFSGQLTTEKGNVIYVDTLRPGLYFLKISDGNGTITRRLIKT